MSIWTSMVECSPTTKIASSLILKDAVGCYLYVNQARTNKKMSPQQRADVANYDLANGFINIGLQLLAIKPIEELMKKFVESKCLKRFFCNLEKRLADKSDYNKLSKLLKDKKNITEGAVAALSVIICQYFIKRVVSPYFSVMAGDKAKELGIIKPKIYKTDDLDGYKPKKLIDLDKLKLDKSKFDRFTKSFGENES